MAIISHKCLIVGLLAVGAAAVSINNQVNATRSLRRVVHSSEKAVVTNKAGTVVRVVNAAQAHGPPQGSIGQIRCGNKNGPLVCVPGWTGGHNGTDMGSCTDTPLESCGPTSNFWMDLSNVENVDAETACGGRFKVGDAVYATTVDDGVKIGMVGKIYCVSHIDGHPGVDWGGLWTGGHAGNIDFCVKSALPRSTGSSNYYLPCDELTEILPRSA